MKTNLNNIWQKCTWQNLQQNCMQQMWDLFVKRRYFKFQNEIQFSSNSIMEQLKHPNSDSFCDRSISCFYQVLHHRPITCMSRSRRNIFLPIFLLLSMGTIWSDVWLPSGPVCSRVSSTTLSISSANVCVTAWKRAAVTSNICCRPNIATGTCLI